jgi:hypothetical protein
MVRLRDHGLKEVRVVLESATHETLKRMVEEADFSTVSDALYWTIIHLARWEPHKARTLLAAAAQMEDRVDRRAAPMVDQVFPGR